MAWKLRIAAPIQFLIVFCAGRVNRHQQAVIEYLLAENAVLNELRGGKRPLLNDGQRRRLAVAGEALGRAGLSRVALMVAPDTILGWYRELVAKKYDGAARRGPGRPRVPLADVILRFARENPTWGYLRIEQAIKAIPLKVSRSTIARVLREHGIEPSPERGRKTSWKEFLASHWGVLVAADFLTVEVLTWGGLVRYHVLFFIELATRRVHLGGITCDPCEEWVMQVARNMTDAFDGFLRKGHNLIIDRDPVFSRAFRNALRQHGVRVLRLPARSPNLNAYAERWVRSIRSECLGRIIPLGESHLTRAVTNYIAHYNSERPHQGLKGRLIDPEPNAGAGRGRIACRRRLGGLLKYYYRLVA